MPDPGYHFAGWSDGPTANPRTDTNVTANVAVTANFREINYSIDATAGPGGSINPSYILISSGGSEIFTATPDADYEVAIWSVDGNVVQTGGTGYTFSDIQANHTIHVTFKQIHQQLSHSLGTFEFDDEEEFESNIISNNTGEPDEVLVLLESVDIGPEPDNLVMGLRNRKDDEGQTVNARAKGVFVRTGANEVLIHFKYLFMTSSVELVVYVSDSPLLLAPDDPQRDEHYIEVARLAPPPFPRPGSLGSNRFAIFEKIVWTGNLDFSEGLYIELELAELDIGGILLASFTPRIPAGNGGSSVYVDDWSTSVQCYGICLDINWDNFVDEADFLTVIGACGCTAKGETACLEGAFSADGYMDSYDVVSWDWAMNSDQRLLNYCGLPLGSASGGIGVGSAPAAGLESSAAPMAQVFLPDDLGDMLITGKRGPANASRKLEDYLYVFDSTGQYSGSFKPASSRGNIRLVKGPEGEIYQLNSETGLVRLDATDEVIVPPGKLEPADLKEPRYNKSATVYIGIQGSDADSFGRPILDVAVDANHVYVVPVVVSPDGSEPYTAVAKLKLLAEGNPPYELVELYDDPPPLHDNQYRNNLRELELDSAGNLYVLNVHALNESDILWRYKQDGTVERLDLGRPDGDTYVPAPTAMHVSPTTDMLYLASATFDPVNPESTIVYGFSTLGAVTLEKFIAIDGMQHVTSMAEDSQTATLWVAGFNMQNIPQYPNPTQPAFYYPHLARVSFESNDVQLMPLFDPASHDLALPMSILWTSSVERNEVH